jgi:hypothetical protein
VAKTPKQTRQIENQKGTGRSLRGRRRKKSFALKSGKKNQPKKTEFQSALFTPLSSRR